MTSLTIEHNLQPRTHNTPDKSHNSDSTVVSYKIESVHDKQIILNQNADEDPFDQQMNKKKNESKQRYRRLKQKLASMCNQHQQKCLFKSNKQVSSSNKSRLLTLAIQFEKMTLNQTKDYNTIQARLKQIYKIIDLKLECDLYILKQSRFIPAFSGLLKKVPTFHKNQFFQAVKTIELGLKIMRVFCTVSSNRDYMISINQLSTLNSCLSSFIGKQQKKLAIQCLNVLFQLLCSKIKADSQQIINITLQIVFFGQLARKLRQSIDQCITQQGLCQQQYVIKCLKYLHILYRKVFEKCLQRPIYQQPEIQTIYQSHIDSLLTQFYHLLPLLLLQPASSESCSEFEGQITTNSLNKQVCLKEQELPVCFINISLYILRLINLCIHVSYRTAQKIIDFHDKNNRFSKLLKLMYQYSMDNMQNSHELLNIYTQIIDLIGKTCCQSEQNKKQISNNGILDLLYNHPIVCIMDHKLKSVLIPTLCTVMDESQVNMKKYLSQNSAQNIISYVSAQKKRYEQTRMKEYSQDGIKELNNLQQQQIEQQAELRNLTRKQSVSSLNSYTTQCTQNSCLPISEQDRAATGLYFLLPYNRWQPLITNLRSLDC